jgi:hypothetical protein
MCICIIFINKGVDYLFIGGTNTCYGENSQVVRSR